MGDGDTGRIIKSLERIEDAVSGIRDQLARQDGRITSLEAWRDHAWPGVERTSESHETRIRTLEREQATQEKLEKLEERVRKTEAFGIKAAVYLSLIGVVASGLMTLLVRYLAG